MHAPHRIDSINLLEEALVDPSLDEQVDMVISNPEPNRYRATTPAGRMEFMRSNEAGRPEYTVVSVEGIDPLRSGATDHLVGLEAELEGIWPDRDANAYPHALDQIAQFFDGAHAPELVAQHTARHRFDENLGQHGSLGIVQARAPFIAAGAGVEALGSISRSARMIDVAPSILHLLGGAPHPAGVGPMAEARPGALLRRQDGDPITDLFEFGRSRHVVVLLLDGCNMNVMYDAITGGGAPAIASLAGRGTTLGHGVLASLPTATLANHTAAGTGAHPGHSGVLHHTWWNRHDDTTPNLLSLSEMFDCMTHLDPSVETIHQAVHRNWPDAFTAAMFEFCDTGADFSSFAEIRNNTSEPLLDASSLPAVDHNWIEQSAAYGFMSGIDELATRQALRMWDPSQGTPLPTFTWLSLSLTDEAGHEAGPHAPMTRSAIADSDRRVGRLIEAVERAGATEDTTFLLFADHGMELSDGAAINTWTEALDATPVPTCDVSSGFIYLDHRT